MKTTGHKVTVMMLAAGVLLAGAMAHGMENVLSFNGTDARVTVLHAAHLSALNVMTAEIRFKTATAKNQGPLSAAGRSGHIVRLRRGRDTAPYLVARGVHVVPSLR